MSCICLTNVLQFNQKGGKNGIHKTSSRSPNRNRGRNLWTNTINTNVPLEKKKGKKMEKTNIKTETYKINIPEEFYIDIIETENNYEAWIYDIDIAYKLHMFTVPKEQQTKEEYLEIVEKNIPEYAIQYCCDVNEMEER